MGMAAAKAPEKVTWRDGEGKVHCEERVPIRRVEADGRWRGLNAEELAQLGWYALVIRGGREAEVEAIIERRGFVAVVPSWREERRVHRRAKAMREVRVPIARGYVLVGFAPGQMLRGLPPWHQLFDISMIAGVVGLDDNGTAWRLSGKQVARFLLDNDTVRPAATVEVATVGAVGLGDVVSIIHGPFAGFRAPVIAVAPDKVRVLVTLFGHETEMELDGQWIARAR